MALRGRLCGAAGGLSAGRAVAEGSSLQGAGLCLAEFGCMYTVFRSKSLFSGSFPERRRCYLPRNVIRSRPAVAVGVWEWTAACLCSSAGDNILFISTNTGGSTVNNQLQYFTSTDPRRDIEYLSWLIARHFEFRPRCDCDPTLGACPFLKIKHKNSAAESLKSWFRINRQVPGYRTKSV